MKISPEEIEKETSEFLERGPSFDPEVVSHIELLFEKLRLRLEIIDRPYISNWNLYDSAGRLLTGGHFHTEFLDEREKPIPYERIYRDISNRHYVIMFPVDSNKKRNPDSLYGDVNIDLIHFPELNPTGKFCIDVDLMPFF